MFRDLFHVTIGVCLGITTSVACAFVMVWAYDKEKNEEERKHPWRTVSYNNWNKEEKESNNGEEEFN